MIKNNPVLTIHFTRPKIYQAHFEVIHSRFDIPQVLTVFHGIPQYRIYDYFDVTKDVFQKCRLLDKFKASQYYFYAAYYMLPGNGKPDMSKYFCVKK